MAHRVAEAARGLAVVTTKRTRKESQQAASAIEASAAKAKAAAEGAAQAREVVAGAKERSS